jgi:hypothetical protein
MAGEDFASAEKDAGAGHFEGMRDVPERAL